jgi:predicted transcriptional regulator
MSDLSSFYGNAIDPNASDYDVKKDYGTKRHSGRYPWGSGENPYQRENRDFLAREKELRDQGFSEIDRAKALGIVKYNGEGDTAALRARKAIATSEVRKADMAEVIKRRDAGMSIAAIAEETGIPGTTVRSLLDPEKAARNDLLMEKADVLKGIVNEKGFVDVGKGVNYELDITEDKLKKSLYILKEQGYQVYNLKVEQVGTGHYTDVKVLCKPGTTFGEANEALKNGEVKAVANYIVKDTDGTTKLGMLPPRSVDSKRIMVRYADDPVQSGKYKDGDLLLGADGKPVTKTVTFVPTQSEGEVVVDIPLDSTNLVDMELVVFEAMQNKFGI